MKIGQLAQKAAVNVQTVRFYEREQLLEPSERLASGYRKFDRHSVERIRFIRNAQRIGYSLEEIRELLEIRVNDENPCDHVRELTKAKIHEVDEKIEVLHELRSRLEKLSALCDHGGPEGECPILEILS